MLCDRPASQPGFVPASRPAFPGSALDPRSILECKRSLKTDERASVGVHTSARFCILLSSRYHSTYYPIRIGVGLRVITSALVLFLTALRSSFLCSPACRLGSPSSSTFPRGGRWRWGCEALRSTARAGRRAGWGSAEAPSRDCRGAPHGSSPSDSPP